MLKVTHFPFHDKYQLILNQQHVSYILGRLHVSPCVASPLLLTTSVNIWSWGDQLLGMLSSSCLIEEFWVVFIVFRCFQVVKHLDCSRCFQVVKHLDCNRCFQVVKHLDCSRCFWLVKHLDCSSSVQQLDSSATKPCCWNRCRMWFNFVLLRYARPSLKKRQMLL